MVKLFILALPIFVISAVIVWTLLFTPFLRDRRRVRNLSKGGFALVVAGILTALAIGFISAVEFM